MTGTLPFTLAFEPMPETAGSARPGLQAYMWMRQPTGHFFILGGRLVGLHQFKTSGNNFPQPNQTIWWCDPSRGLVQPLLDLTLVSPEIGGPLMATDQQSYHDVEAGEWLIVGGYGIDNTHNQLRTFDTLIRIPIDPFENIMLSGLSPSQKAASFERIVSVQHDPLFGVTGGTMGKIGGRYLLLFGQRMDGSYNPFVGSLAQVYTEAVRFFRFDGQRRAIGMGELKSPDLDKPFHRRDGPIVNSVDPVTGLPRIIAFGGVFPPGKLGGYLNPVYVETRDGRLAATTDRSVEQLFCQYTCPVIVIWDAPNKAVYHTFFGGISRSWYWQNDAQQKVYLEVTAEGRNDGLPFIADISTLVLGANGQSAEWVAPAPIPDYKLHGTSTDFIPLPNALNPAISEAGVIDIGRIPAGEQVLLGHIYGGVEASYPLPVIPNYGSSASSTIYRVWLTAAPAGGYIPARDGHLAYGVLTPPSNSGVTGVPPPPP